MGELRSVLDALAVDDLHGLSAGALMERTADLARFINRAAAELTRTVRHADPGGRLWTRRVSVSGRFDLDAVGGEKMQAAIESLVQASRPEGDLRNRGQRQADALVQLCDNQLAAGNLPFLRTVEPQVFATIAVEDLVDPGTVHGAGTLGFGATISAARARWIACDASVTRIVLGPGGLPLDVGRTKRVVPPLIRHAVEQRDG